MGNTITFVFAIIHLILALLYVAKRRRLLYQPYKSFFIFMYALCFYGGIVLAFIIYNLTGYYKNIHFDLFIWVIIYADIGLFSFFIGNFLFPGKKIRQTFLHMYPRKYQKHWAFACILGAISAISIYIIDNGGFFIFRSSGYVERYTANYGSGVITSLFVLFLVSY